MIREVPVGAVVRIGEDIMAPPLLIGRYGHVTAQDAIGLKAPKPSDVRIHIDLWPTPTPSVWVPAHWLTRLATDREARFFYVTKTAQHQGELKQAHDLLAAAWEYLRRLSLNAGRPLYAENAMWLDALKIVNSLHVRPNQADNQARDLISQAWEQLIQAETRYRKLTDQMIVE